MQETFSNAANWIKDWWPVLAGFSLFFYWAAVRWKRRLFAAYETTDSVNRKIEKCKDDVCTEIKEMRKENQQQHEHIMKVFVSHLDK